MTASPMVSIESLPVNAVGSTKLSLEAGDSYTPGSLAAGATSANVAALGIVGDEEVALAITETRKSITALGSTNEDTCIEAMRRVWRTLQAVSTAPRMASIIFSDCADVLVENLLTQVNIAFGAGASSEPQAAKAAGDQIVLPEPAASASIRHRLCKYALNTIMETFKHPHLATCITPQTVRRLNTTLLGRLLDGRLRQLKSDDEVKGLIRGLNVLMLKVLESTDFTTSFRTLLKLLSDTCADPSHKTFVDLVVKCLVKLAKKLGERMDSLNVASLLLGVHDFLATHPPSSFARAGQPVQPGQKTDDNPLKAMRTIVTELIKLLGTGIEPHLSQLPKDSRVVSWYQSISLSLKNATASNETKSSGTNESNQIGNESRSGSTTPSEPSSSNPSSSSSGSSTSSSGMSGSAIDWGMSIAPSSSISSSVSTSIPPPPSSEPPSLVANAPPTRISPLNSISTTPQTGSSQSSIAPPSAIASPSASTASYGTRPMTPRRGTVDAPPPLTPRHVLTQMTPATLPPQFEPLPSRQVNGTSVPLNMDPQQCSEYLDWVFLRLRDKTTTSAGLKQLYAFTVVYPQHSIDPHLSRATVSFREYVTGELQRAKSNAQRQQGNDIAPSTPNRPHIAALSFPSSSTGTTPASLTSSVTPSGLGAGVGGLRAPGGGIGIASLEDRMSRIRSVAQEQNAQMQQSQQQQQSFTQGHQNDDSTVSPWGTTSVGSASSSSSSHPATAVGILPSPSSDASPLRPRSSGIPTGIPTPGRSMNTQLSLNRRPM